MSFATYIGYYKFESQDFFLQFFFIYIVLFMHTHCYSQNVIVKTCVDLLHVDLQNHTTNVDLLHQHLCVCVCVCVCVSVSVCVCICVCVHVDCL